MEEFSFEQIVDMLIVLLFGLMIFIVVIFVQHMLLALLVFLDYRLPPPVVNRLSYYALKARGTWLDCSVTHQRRVNQYVSSAKIYEYNAKRVLCAGASCAYFFCAIGATFHIHYFVLATSFVLLCACLRFFQAIVPVLNYFLCGLIGERQSN